MKNLQPKPVLVSARTDEDGDSHAIYHLPRAIPWRLNHYELDEEADGLSVSIPPSEWQQTTLIDRIRICVATSEWPFPTPAVIIVPIDSLGQEWPSGSLHFRGKVASTFSALILLGFQPHLHLN